MTTFTPPALVAPLSFEALVATYRARALTLAEMASDRSESPAVRRDAVRLANVALHHAWQTFHAALDDRRFVDGGDHGSAEGMALDDTSDALLAFDAAVRRAEQALVGLAVAPRLAAIRSADARAGVAP